MSNTPSILGLCNPLLDITATVDKTFLAKYDLLPNNIILGDDTKKHLVEDLISKYPVEYGAGGSAQNVMRVAAALCRHLQIRANVMFSGGIGEDDFGAQMEAKAKKDGVNVNYQKVTDGSPTGTCAVMLTDQGKNRSLCAFLGASQKFSLAHLEKNWDSLVENTDIIYMSGFLLSVQPEIYFSVSAHVAKDLKGDKRFCLNLSAPYISQCFGKELEKVIEYSDIVFGNNDEALAYSTFKNWNTTDLKEIVTKIANEPKKRNSVRRLAIITQGEGQIIVSEQSDGTSESSVRSFDCDQMNDEEIVDTNGAGDAFCGGFLAQYISNSKSLESCIALGSYAAREIIKMSGIVIPEFKNIPQL